MTKADILELKRNMLKTKEDADGKTDNTSTCDAIAGCYVAADNTILTTFNTEFFMLDEHDQNKYIDIAKKTLSGKLGNNLLELSFSNDSENDSKQDFFLALREDEFLKKEENLTSLYESIIESRKETNKGSYVILLYHQTYSVFEKDMANDLQLKDNEVEYYRYIICAICPVTQKKDELRYIAEDKMFSVRLGDMILDNPETAFAFPDFTDRSANIHSVMFYAKDPEEISENMVKNVLGCDLVQTSDEKKTAFNQMLATVLCEEPNVSRLIYDINDELKKEIEVPEEVRDAESGAIKSVKTVINDIDVSDDVFEEVLETVGVSEAKTAEILDSYRDCFTGDTSVNQIIDRKLLKDEMHTRREEELLDEIMALREENRELKQKIEELTKSN